MPAWPANIPQRFDADGFTYTPGQGAIRTEMDSGPAFQRQRYTAVVDKAAGSMTMTFVEYGALMQFYRVALSMGTLAFDWMHPLTGESARMRFDSSKPPAAPATSGIYLRVQLSVEIL